MKRTILALAAASAVLALTGCGGGGMSADLMREIADARDTCVELDGTFEQWAAEFGPRWRCNFDEGTDR